MCAKKTIAVETVAEAYLTLMAERGIEYLFANGGTDFAPVIEALAAINAKNTDPKLKVVSVGHENVATSMANELLPPYRPAADGDVPCECRHRQRHQRADRCIARPRADHLHRRPHADHRNRPQRLARHRHPLAAGDVRPGRHGARILQMGLRAAQRRAARSRGRSRDRDRNHRALRPGLSHPAARGDGAGDHELHLRGQAAARLRHGAGPDGGADRRRRRDPRQGRAAADHRAKARRGSPRARRRSPSSRKLSPFRSSSSAPTSTCSRPSIRCSPDFFPARCSRMPMRC